MHFPFFENDKNLLETRWIFNSVIFKLKNLLACKMLTFFQHFPFLFVKIWDAQFHKIVSDIGYFSETFRLKNAIGEVSIFTKDIIDSLK